MPTGTLEPVLQEPDAAHAAAPRAATSVRPSTNIRALYTRWYSQTPGRLRQRRTRRSRSILVQSALGFALVQIVVASVLLTFGAPWRDPIFHARLARLQAKQQLHPDRPVAILLGSSRTLNGLDLAAIEQASEARGTPMVFGCFATPGAGALTQRFQYERVLSAGVRPDFVVMEAIPSVLDAQLLAVELDAARLPTHRLLPGDLALIERHAPVERPSVYLDLAMHWAVPVYGFRFALVHQISPRLLPANLQLEFAAQSFEFESMHGADVLWHPEQRGRGLQLARQEHFDNLQRFRADNAGCQALCDLLADCRTQGIATAVVVPPEGKAFRSWYSAASRRELQVLVDRLNETERTPVVNAWDWVADDAAFADAHHLLRAGAGLYTRRFCAEVLPLLEGKRCFVPPK